MSTRPAVFVCAATGSQGFALARKLLEMQWSVHATVRDLESPAARILRHLGAQLVQGDWDDHAALHSAIAGCEKLFLCLVPDFSDMRRELRLAKSILVIAKAAGVSQVVSSTSLGVSMLENDPQQMTLDSVMAHHLASKKGIEDAVRNGGFNHWTFLRPSFFMANFLEPKVARYPEPRDRGTWTTALTQKTRLGLIDHVDIAAFAVAVFQQPTKFQDRAIGLASEFLPVQETLDLLGQAAGRSFKAVFMTDAEIEEKRETSSLFVNSQVALRYMEKYVDMQDIVSVIRPTSFHEFLEREKTDVRETYA